MTCQNDRQDRSLTGQVLDQAGHCPLTGRYLQPCYVKVLIFFKRICYSCVPAAIFSNEIDSKNSCLFVCTNPGENNLII